MTSIKSLLENFQAKHFPKKEGMMESNWEREWISSLPAIIEEKRYINFFRKFSELKCGTVVKEDNESMKRDWRQLIYKVSDVLKEFIEINKDNYKHEFEKILEELVRERKRHLLVDVKVIEHFTLD